MRKLTIEIERDDDADSPRDYDVLGTMICFHKRYQLGDKHHFDSRDFDSFEDIEDHLRRACDATVIVPVYLLDHSGLALSHAPFGCRWDSGQIGWIYTTDHRMREAGVDTHDHAKEILIAEVREYHKYVAGEYCCWMIRDEDGDVVDCCCGYSDYEDAMSVAQEVLAALLAEDARQDAMLACTRDEPACAGVGTER